MKIAICKLKPSREYYRIKAANGVEWYLIYISLLQVQYASKKLQGTLRKEFKLQAGR